MALLVFADTIKQPETNKRVIQSDHFSSEAEKIAKYTLEHIDKDKPLILLLKDKQPSTIQKNPVSVKLGNGSSEVDCRFVDY